ncbi:MAG: carbonic anhydrase, partial [Alcaligenaceae bacterium]|nr:carbonic anhydrase [Alcaligenaceae bacterium]
NARFRSGKMQSHDFLAQKRATATGQYPAAVILSCIDSRAPGEIIFDTGIGDAFGARIAGNIATPDLIGSMEFACAVAGAKLVLALGHTGCGAIAGAINGVKLGNLTGLLQQIEPAVKATTYDGERTGSNRAFVDAVARQNVQLTVNVIRQNSAILAGLEKDGKIKMIGAMYDLSNGEVAFLH